MPRRLAPVPQTPFVVGEIHDIPFRFGGEMSADETVADVDVECVSVGATVDPDAAATVTEPHALVAPAGSLVESTVVQRFAALVPYTRYVLSVTATMSSGRVMIGQALVSVLPKVRT
jgi:hypothetical protein